MNSFSVDNMVEVKLTDEHNFLKIRETLDRIGIVSVGKKTISPSCVILHKKGKYYIAHFKEMFLLDGRQANFTSEDMGRRNRIVKLLSDWNLLSVVDETNIEEPLAAISSMKIVPFKEKNQWKVTRKYTVGKINNKTTESENV